MHPLRQEGKQLSRVYPCERHLEATRRLNWERILDIAHACAACQITDEDTE